MDKKQMNDALRRNVAQLSKIAEKEASMMPATVAPLPSVEHVKQIVKLVKSIIFPDYGPHIDLLCGADDHPVCTYRDE